MNNKDGDKMPSSLLLLIFNFCLLFILPKSVYGNSVLQLSIYPSAGYSTENIELRCQISEPSFYDNIYLSVRTDNVKPSGILLMVDNTANQCRTDKKEHIRIYSCNSSLILIEINHTVYNDSLHTIEYACSQGGTTALSSYQILKDRAARYNDPKSSNSSSSSLTQTIFRLLFVLLISQLTTIEQVRWLFNDE